MGQKNKKNTKWHDWMEYKKETNQVCASCGRIGETTIDHIVPVQILMDLGYEERYVRYDYDDNFQYLCFFCNQRKMNRLDITNHKTLPLLEQAIAHAKKFLEDK